MKIENITNALKKKDFEFEVDYGKWLYWENVPYVQLRDGRKLFICEIYAKKGVIGCNDNFKLKDVLLAIEKFNKKEKANNNVFCGYEWNCKIENGSSSSVGLYLQIEKEDGWL